MKIINLIYEYRPQCFCGAEIGAAGLAGGLGLLGNIVGSSQSSSNVQSQLSAQSAENQKNRDWQTAEAEKARQWQQNILGQQNQFQSQLQQQSYQHSLGLQAQQAKYQSPVYMRKQLEEAGINPQVYFGQSASFSGSSAPIGGSPSAPNTPGPAQVGSVGGLNPVGFQPFGTSIGSIVSGLGSALHSAAEARKLGIESDWLPQMLRAQVRNLNKDSDLKTILKVGQEIHNEIDKAKMPYSLRQAEAELYKSLSEIDLNSQKTLTEQSQQQLNRAIEGVQNAMKSLNEKESEKLGLEMPFVVSLIKSKIADLSGSAAEHAASAGLRVSEKDAQDMANKVRSYGLNDEMDATLQKWISDSSISSAKRQDAENQLTILRTIGSQYRDSDSKRKFDAALQSLFDMLGFHVSLSGHN